MIVEFLPQARSELIAAVEYYEDQLIGLGQRFWDEVDQHISWIVANPEIPRLRTGGYRRNLVTIYFHPPQTKYDEIALIDTSSKSSLSITAQGKTDVVIRRLKEEAAKLGANGVLLQGVGDQSGGSVTTGFGQASASGNHAYGTGIGISSNVMYKAGSGIAIYVEPVPAN